MLLFIVLLVDSLPCPDHISIHLMLLFISDHPFQNNILFRISIHLMLLFISGLLLNKWCNFLFQYISCYCLSYCPSRRSLIFYEFQYISCYCLSFCFYFPVHFQNISIHLMLLFILLVPTPTYNVPSFQYISCYCLSDL